MKRPLLQSMSALHTWGGLVFGWLLFVVLLSGSAAVYRAELTHWLTPEVASRAVVDRTRALALGEAFLRGRAPEHRLWRITLPSRREPVIKVSWRAGPTPNGDARLDPATGAPITRVTEGGDFYLHLHEGLLIDRAKNRIGLYVVGLSGLALLVAAVSGILIHKRIFKDLFLFRPAASRQRSWLDAHNVLGVLPLPFHAVMAFTGVLLLYWMFVPAGVQALYGGKEPPFRAQAIALDYQQPPSVPRGEPRPTPPLAGFLHDAERRLGAGGVAYLWVRDMDRSTAVVEAYRERTDRVSQQVPQIAYEGASGRVVRALVRRSPAAEAQSAMAAVHWLEWGGPAVRLVYFVAGLAGAGAVAAGLVVFITKRRRRPEGGAAWMRAVEAVSLAATAGATAAHLAFLWAERLAPANASGRAEAGVHAFLWTWVATLAHAAVRGPGRAAWAEQLGLAGLLALGAPLLGGGLWRHLAERDADRLGIDGGLLVIGALLVAGAVRTAGWRLGARPRPAAQPA